MKILATSFALLIITLTLNLKAQDDLMDMLGDTEPTTDYAFATFKSTRISLGQSVENPANGNLIFDIQHHFGPANSGFDDFFGLDQATTRLGLQYGLTDWLVIGIGRTTLEKTVDGLLKAKLLQQSTGAVNMPVSVSYFGSMALSTLKLADPVRTNYFSSRLSFAHQLLIARKFSPAISIQLSPTFIHRNLVEKNIDDNDVLALGAGGRFKLSNRVSLNLEYYYVLSTQTAKDYDNSLTLGFDIETGGHVFQLFLTNSQGIIEEHFIPRTSGKWLNGDIHFGFNITRTFVLKKPKEFRD
jgi:opacity protein-like surface antigen